MKDNMLRAALGCRYL